MISRDKLVDFLNESLAIDRYADASLNGLQIEGSSEVSKIAVAVDASVLTAKRAVEAGADFLIVHHGLLWAKAFPITGRKQELIKILLESNTSLYAAHLPLDANPEVGNNFCLARMLEMSNLTSCFRYDGSDIGVCGDNAKALPLSSIVEKLSSLPGVTNDFLTLEFGPKTPKRIGIVSGSGADALHDCPQHDIDTLITGEPRHFAYHLAREEQRNVIFAGHYVTETIGVREVAKLLESEFSLPWSFIDLPTGI